MDFLKTSWTQITDLFQSMTPGSRMITALLLVAIVVSFGYLFTFDGGTRGESLMYGQPIPFSSLPAMESAFQTAGLSDYTIRGDQIFVPTNQRGKYMAALTEGKALPPNFSTILDSAFADLGAFATTTEKNIAIKTQKQRLLAWAINAMQNIDNAIVMFDEIKTNPIFGDSKHTAMVSVSTTNGQALTKKQVMSIRYLVAGAIAGLTPTEVTIADQSGMTYPGGDDGPGPGGAMIGPYISRLEQYEAILANKIYGLLSFIPGIKVSVTYELDPETSKTEDSYEVGPKPVPIASGTSSTSVISQSTKTGGRPGFASNSGESASIGSGGSTGTSLEETTDDTNTISIASTKLTKTSSLGLIPNRAVVSISVPTTYFIEEWKRLNPPVEGEPPQPPDLTMLTNLQSETFDNIKDLIVGHLPDVPGVTDKKQFIQLMAFTPPTPLAIVEASAGSETFAWLEGNWGTFGALALVLVSLMMIRSMTRQPAVAKQATADEAETIIDEEEGSVLDESAIQRLLDFGEVGPSLRDELAKLVEQDPNTASNILKNWIGVVD